MALKNRFFSLNGQIIGEEQVGGTRIDYATDAVGSVTGTLVHGAIQNTYAYKPYGQILSKTGSGIDPAFQWIGKFGYQWLSRTYSEIYVRARWYSNTTLRWCTRDPFPPDAQFGSMQPYEYGGSVPSTSTDRSGLRQSYPTPIQIPPDKAEGGYDKSRIDELGPSYAGVSGCTITTGNTWRYTQAIDSGPTRKAIFDCVFDDHEFWHTIQYAPCCAAAGAAFNDGPTTGYAGLFRYLFIRSDFYAWVDHNACWDEASAYAHSVACFEKKHANCAAYDAIQPGYCDAMKGWLDTHRDAYNAAIACIANNNRNNIKPADCPFPGKKRNPKT